MSLFSLPYLLGIHVFYSSGMQRTPKVIQRDIKVEESLDYTCPVLQPRECEVCIRKDLLKEE